MVKAEFDLRVNNEENMEVESENEAENINIAEKFKDKNLTFTDNTMHKIVRLVADGLREHFGRNPPAEAYKAAGQSIVKLFAFLKIKSQPLGYVSSFSF